MSTPKRSSNREKINKPPVSSNNLSDITTKIMEKAEGKAVNISRLNVRVPLQMRNMIMEMSKREGRTEGDTVRLIINRYFQEHPLS